LETEAQAIEKAVDDALASGARTADIAPRGGSWVKTVEFAQEILGRI
jgi:isocitrate dehydrogenase